VNCWTATSEARLSPDGKQILLQDADPENDKDAHKWGMSSKPYLLNVATKKRTPLADFPLNGQVLSMAWSPNGKQVAYTWEQLHPDWLKLDTHEPEDEAKLETEAFLCIADADGKNMKTLDSAKKSGVSVLILGMMDWR
jgi:hypothetical protein